jgi:ssDNA-binding Zn-finger/Zn-ribbon topoisomerase 1
MKHPTDRCPKCGKPLVLIVLQNGGQTWTCETCPDIELQKAAERSQ